MKRVWSLIFSIVAILVLANCGEPSVSIGDDGEESNPPSNKVQWEKVSSEFNPSVEEYEMSLEGIDTLKMSVFGIQRDVAVAEDSRLSKNSAILKAYRVSKNVASFGYWNHSVYGRTFEVSKHGSYRCNKIVIENGRITELDGGCYVRLRLHLSPSSRLKVYNAGTRIK